MLNDFKCKSPIKNCWIYGNAFGSEKGPCSFTYLDKSVGQYSMTMYDVVSTNFSSRKEKISIEMRDGHLDANLRCPDVDNVRMFGQFLQNSHFPFYSFSFPFIQSGCVFFFFQFQNESKFAFIFV